jgi:methyl-accepting chemotaxis protein
MEELEKIVRQLVEQIKTMADSVTLLIQRSEQLYKLQEERLNLLPQLVENQSHAIEELEATNQALQDSLDDLDGATDDIAKTTAALLIIQKQWNEKLQNEPSEQ